MLSAWQISVPFCSSSVSDSCNRWRLNTSLSVGARISELLSVKCSTVAEESVYILTVCARHAPEGRKASEV